MVAFVLNLKVFEPSDLVVILRLIGGTRQEQRVIAPEHNGLMLIVLFQELFPEFFLGELRLSFWLFRIHHVNVVVVSISQLWVLIDQPQHLVFIDAKFRVFSHNIAGWYEHYRLILNSLDLILHQLLVQQELK
jgi:hypothetical protein